MFLAYAGALPGRARPLRFSPSTAPGLDCGSDRRRLSTSKCLALPARRRRARPGVARLRSGNVSAGYNTAGAAERIPCVRRGPCPSRTGSCSGMPAGARRTIAPHAGVRPCHLDGVRAGRPVRNRRPLAGRHHTERADAGQSRRRSQCPADPRLFSGHPVVHGHGGIHVQQRGPGGDADRRQRNGGIPPGRRPASPRDPVRNEHPGSDGDERRRQQDLQRHREPAGAAQGGVQGVARYARWEHGVHRGAPFPRGVWPRRSRTSRRRSRSRTGR